MSDDQPNKNNELTQARLLSSLNDDRFKPYEGGIILLPPGIEVSDIKSFLNLVLGEIDQSWNIIPDSLPSEGVRLSTFNFNPKSNQFPFELGFTLDWTSAHWEMIPGILTLASPNLTLSISGQATPFNRLQVRGTVSGVVEIENIPIYIEVSLPSGSFKAQLLKEGDPADTDAKPQTGDALFKSFQVGANIQEEAGDDGFDLGALTLDDLTVLGNVPARRLLLHLALGNIELGPGELATQLTIDYFGGANSQISGMIGGRYDIHKGGDSSKAILFSIMLAAAYDGPGKSWKFEGGAASSTDASIKDLIEVFTDSQNIPSIFEDLHINYLHLAYETGSGNFEFQCDVAVDKLFEEDATVEMIIDVQLHKTGSGYAKTFSGRLIFTLESGTILEFDLLFDTSASHTTFIAAYKNPSGGDININDLIQLISQSAPSVPLSIKLQDAFFVYDKQGEQNTSLFGLDIGGGIDLSALPLVGKVLPKEASLNFGIQPLVAFGDVDAQQLYFSADELARISALVPGGGITLPSREIKEKVGLSINIVLGQETTFHFDLPIELNTETEDDSSAEGAIETTADDTVSTSPATAGTTPAPAGSTASGIQWLKVGKHFGPVNFDRIGLQFESDTKMIWAYLDGGLSVGPLTFSLNGLGMGTLINELKPKFRLLGIGLDYKSGPVEIGASFLRMQLPMNNEDGEPSLDQNGTPVLYDEYSGLAIIKTSSLSLSAIGAYADLPEYKSLFIYAALNSPLGGPAFFFVTGLAAGFGFNRAVKPPDISGVGQFPLVNLAVGGAGSPVPADSSGRADYIHTILDQLRGSIYPMKGQYFIAAGLRFSSFKLIDSFALLIVQFGEHFEIDVLGLSTLIAPPPVSEEEKVTPIAEVQLAIKAVFNPSEGILSVEAQLTQNSFILDRNCHLTGGFAFYTWFGGPHEGDFVLSLGGYHPDFNKPAHYPTVPRLGLNWQVNSDLTIKGGIYFALTPHMVMAGGGLEAIYQSGSKLASFKLAADFLIAWKPYHYDARASLDIHVEYTYHLFGTQHIDVSVDAEVHVWGPDFAGHAHIHLWCVTFDIDFGAKTTPKLEPLSWLAFSESFLPKEAAKFASVAVVNGLLRQEQSNDGASTIQVINPKEFQLRVDLVIPYTDLSVGGETLATTTLLQETVRGETRVTPFVKPEGGHYAQSDFGQSVSPNPFGIAPMGISNEQLTSASLQLNIEQENIDGTWHPIEQDFGYRPVLKRGPKALWGAKLQQELNEDSSIDDLMMGIDIIPATAPKSGETKWVAKSDLQYNTTSVKPGISFETITSFESVDLESSLANHLRKKETVDKRRDMFEALGFDYDRLGIKLEPTIVDSLVKAPQIGRLV